MRLKAIPGDIADAVKDNPIMLVGGLAVIGLGAYLYMANPAPVEPVESYDGSSYLGSYSGFMPISTGVSGGLNAGSAGGTVVSSITNPPAGAETPEVGQVTTRELFDFEKLKETHDYELAIAQLQQNADITAANAALSMASLQASMFGASASLASSMLASGNTSLLGAFFGPNGETWSFGLATTKVADSKKNKKNAGILASNQQGLSALDNFLASMSRINNVSSSGPSAASTPTYVGGPNAMLAPPSGSVAVATINNGYSSSGASQSAYNVNIATGQATNEGNGTERVGGINGRFFNSSNAIQ